MVPGSFLAAKQVATRNILAPLLWLCAIVFPTGIIASHFFTGLTSSLLIGAALVPPAITILAYIFWTFRDPDRLQSEEFVLQQRWMTSNPQIGDNSTQEVIDVTAAHSQLTANAVPTKGR